MTDSHEPFSGANPRTSSGPVTGPSTGPRTGIIRRAPTGAIPIPTTRVAQHRPPPAPAPVPYGGPAVPESSGKTAIATSAVTILSGWATAVVATDLIAGWWGSDRLFCVAVGFLTLVFAATTVSGVILLLRRQPYGRYLIAVGAVIALLTFGSVFIAGARVPWIVHTIPVLQIASGVLALLPATKRWLVG
ncbi:hypothetical protein [Mycobacterium talmoniae]|uniref:Uncharacterized protein n=1 Tax=Mycobacterium talmoniae TaxID=1858794 RepID=A0A1S1NF70_9MYCO|nr:hypothetical protein BKN37_10665 [Mycobacterium talmoniae]